MNIQVLKERAKSLIFEDKIVDNKAFISATNRAIARTRMVFPKEITIRIPQYPITNQLGESFNQIDIKGERVFYGNDIKGYSFFALGCGNFSIYYFNNSQGVNDYERILSIDIDNNNTFKCYKGLVKRFNKHPQGKFKIVFSSDYQFSIKNIALYNVLLSPKEEDVPVFSKYVKYDLNTLTEEVGESGDKRKTFISLSKPIVLEKGEEEMQIEYKIEGSILEVPRKYRGLLRVTYLASHKPLSIDCENSETIDVPPQMEEFLAYLIASNLILEEDKELSSYYFNLYKEGENYSKEIKNVGNTKYISTRLWC